jgi:hypothetical protein
MTSLSGAAGDDARERSSTVVRLCWEIDVHDPKGLLPAHPFDEFIGAARESLVNRLGVTIDIV